MELSEAVCHVESMEVGHACGTSVIATAQLRFTICHKHTIGVNLLIWIFKENSVMRNNGTQQFVFPFFRNILELNPITSVTQY